MWWKSPGRSQYVFCSNNPVNRVDPDGNTDYYNKNGKKIGTDGVNDQRRIVVTDNKEAGTLSKTKGNINASNVTSGFTLPSAAALNESLNVLKRTKDNGGKREESSLVMNNGQIIRGETGPYQEKGSSILTATLPDIPVGQTATDVETTIHSHPTAMDWNKTTGETSYSTATEPGPLDKDAFADFQMNIIVGPLGAPNAVSKDQFGNMTPPSAQSNGVVFYNNSSRDLQLKLTEKAVKRILGEK
jgi:hypothetical protein